MYFQQEPQLGDVWSDLRDKLFPQVMMAAAEGLELIPSGTTMQGSNPIPSVVLTEQQKILAAQQLAAKNAADNLLGQPVSPLMIALLAAAGYGLYRAVRG